MEESCFGFGKAKETALLKKQAKFKGEAFWHLNRYFLCNALCQNLGIRLAPNSWDNMPVLALELGTLFPNSAKAGFGGFGLGLLIGQGFLGAKAPLDPLCHAFLI